MKRTRIDFVEIIHDEDLQKREKAATKAIRAFYPDSGPVKLYRTSDGRVGFQAQIAVAVGERKRLDEAYRAVTRALGEKRGRRAGIKRVQTKLHLPEPVYHALKAAARSSQATMSAVVADALRVRLRQGHRFTK